MAWLDVVRPGPLTTVQDHGRVGCAASGVGRSGAVDLISHDAANRLVGNAPHAATLEITTGGFAAQAVGPLTVAVTGARAPVTVNARPVADYSTLRLDGGDLLEIGYSTTGLRTYLAVRGGIDVPETLRSRSTDTLAELGPAPVRAGDHLLVGVGEAEWPIEDFIPPPAPTPCPVPLGITLGPRDDWFTPASVHALLHHAWTVTEDTDRVGVRLRGPGPLHRSRTCELPSEGVVSGSVQVPPNGHPVIFLADHPVTGGYPVIAVVTDPGIATLAQMRPGSSVTFRAA
ncbi:allophanate hydrolase [Rhodococcus sp. AD45-ID]|uniref:5-oxoprolinase subunit C family protein n=1 Tax=unclassified Rhodococcus (in: high G+C Gram-positive bacteria) TaxID=192944 RepID=UPI0005D315C5|nr:MULTISPECIES: biotin-dependent carboxyltransferase family protein [unclassified Rhodococcus (in: high G+C Gram-positive bacteria)]KJF20684.1 Allophanate hydrolase subunit 2 [Rhodococcus sp. AD45]PSR38277.1 allophanate hydrolase [Rhodococcus sp. AD45-ID]